MKTVNVRPVTIIIIIIILLGIGIAFLRGVSVSKSEEVHHRPGGTVRDLFVDELKSKGEKLYLLGQPEFEVRKGAKKDVFYGISNILETNKTFVITQDCSEGINGGDNKKLSLLTFQSWKVESGNISMLKLIIGTDHDIEVDTYPCYMQLTTDKGVYARVDYFIKVSE